MTIVAFTGIREIADIMNDEVELAVLDEIGSGATELRFGGALGADTLALEAACDQHVRRVVYVPFRLRDQPEVAREAVENCADQVIELHRRKGMKSAYFERNRAMVDGADRVVAFTDGRDTGGTAYTIREADRVGIHVTIVHVQSTGRQGNPQLRGVEFSGPVYALAEYVSASRGRHTLSELIRDNKIGRAKSREIQALAEQLSSFISRTPTLSSANVIVAMPRRQPHVRSDMAALARAIARTLGLDVYDLVRVTEPMGGVEAARRLRFPSEEHARTLRYEGPPGATVIVLDNVITTGASMEGALRAISSSGSKPLGLAVLFSESFDLEPF